MLLRKPSSIPEFIVILFDCIIFSISWYGNIFFNDEILPNCKDAVILSEDIVVTAEDEETISLNVVYKINEEVGYFKGR